MKRLFGAALAVLCLSSALAFAQAPAPTTTTTVAAPQATVSVPSGPVATTITVPASANPTAVVIPASSATETPAWLNILAVAGIGITMLLVGWAISIFNKKAGLETNAVALQTEAYMRDALHTGLESLAGRLIVQLGPKINSEIMTIQNPTVRAVAQNAPALFNDALKFFGLSEDTLAQKLIDTVGRLTAGNPLVSPAAQPAKVV